MKLKLDENIPASLKAELAAIGHDVDTVTAVEAVSPSATAAFTRFNETAAKTSAILKRSLAARFVVLKLTS